MANSATVTILFTDVVGSTALTQKLGDARAQEVLVDTHNRIVRETLSACGGSEIKHTGDGIMASFQSATRAIECAIEMQRAFARHNEEAEEPVRVRIGLNAGEPIAEEEDLFGAAVQLAARICAEAEPGEILVSSVVHELTAGKGFAFGRERGMPLKGFAEPVRVCKVNWREGEDSPAIAKRGKKKFAIAAVVALICLCVALVWVVRRPQTLEQAKPSKKDQEIHFCTTTDGVRIAYATSGEGDPPVVRVLGWLTHLEYEWQNPLTRPFHDVAAGHLLVRYDGRGMGLSDREVSDFSLEARVRDLETVVDDLGLERFALYAVSEGGPTAITYTVRHPERVTHLILYGAYASGRKYHSELGQEELDTRLDIVRQGWGSDVPAHRQFFAGLFMPDADGEAIRVFTELQRVSTGAENAVALITANWDMDVTQLLDQVAAPTLVIHRRGDVVVPFERGRELAAGIPGARFLPLEGRNHAILPDDPVLEIRNKAIEEFLSEDFETTAQAEKVSEAKTYSSIAVLPFEDMSAAKDQEYFCDGISEELINALSRFEDLRVIARTSAFSFKGRGMKISDIGRELNVEAILDGSVRRSGNQVRITAELVNVADNSELWRGKYEKEMKDIFAVQDEITGAIVNNLMVELLGARQLDSAERYDTNPEVYDLYLKGRHFLSRGTLEDVEKAIEYFKKAIEKDPNYARAYAGLADSYITLPVFTSSLESADTLSDVKEAALKALEIDDKLAEAHSSMGIVKGFEWDWDGAEAEHRQAIQLNPGNAHIRHWYAVFLTLRGRFDEGIMEIKLARELDPFSPIINMAVGQILVIAGRSDQAIEVLQNTLEIFPYLPYTHQLLGTAYFKKEMYEEALAEFEAEKQLFKMWNPHLEATIGVIYARMGRREEAQEILDILSEQTKEKYIPPIHLAGLSFALGEDERGFEWLNKAQNDAETWLCFMDMTGQFDSVRSDPRYVALLKKMNLDK